MHGRMPAMLYAAASSMSAAAITSTALVQLSMNGLLANVCVLLCGIVGEKAPCVLRDLRGTWVA